MFGFRDFNVLSVVQGSMIVTGLVTTVKLIRTFADLTYPSFPRKTLITLPTFHFPRWTFSSAINTRSPIAKLLRGFIHFALSCSVDTYYNSQPFQNMSDMYPTCTTCCNGGCCIYGYLPSQKIQRANLDLLSITINDLVWAVQVAFGRCSLASMVCCSKSLKLQPWRFAAFHHRNVVVPGRLWRFCKLI